MQTEYTGYIDQNEWRWVTLVSLTILLLIFAPFLLMAFQNPVQSDAQFMGALHDYQDSAAHISRMEQGVDGNLLVAFLYTAQDHPSALVQPLYALLGRITDFTGQTSITIYHIMRIFAGLFMYLTIYHLGASIWVKVRTRRIFFIIASIGSGLGWLVILFPVLAFDTIIPDLMIPQIYPIYASAANVHYPLTIASLALIVSILVPVLRPGGANQPSADNGAALAFIASLVLAFIYPEALLPLGMAYIVSVLVCWYSRKQITPNEWQWGLWLIVPSLPVVVYGILTMLNNDVVAGWLQQRSYEIPSIPMLLIGLGLPLVTATPGLIRAFRRFEADGDRFMLLWFISMLILMYLPWFDQFMLIGLMLPLAYFATRSIEDFWFTYIKRRYRMWVYFTFVPLLILSHIIWLLLPVMPTIMGWGLSQGFLEKDYSGALLWLDEQATRQDVIMASPDVSLWIPAWTGSHTIYGHPTETLDASNRLADVLTWYAAEDSSNEICNSLIETFSIDYIILGPRESESACFENLVPIIASDAVTIYAPTSHFDGEQ